MANPTPSAIDAVLRFGLGNRPVVVMVTILLVAWGFLVAPFDWRLDGVARDPVPVDAIPDTGENQQIVFSEWPGRSPQDVEDQVTYPLTVALLGVPGVKTIRSSSMLGFSSVFVIFDDDVEFYWSRSRILEKLASLPAGALPDGVQPRLGPDATPLGQVFWYTLEGRDADGRPAGGWDLHELRSIQDWQVRYALAAVDGVAEVASIGGYVREYQIDVDPDAMRAHGVTLRDVFGAVRASNVDVGARTIEVNRAEYVVRGLGFVRSLADLEDVVLRSRDGVPILIKHIANVSWGPALRRGVLDKEGVEAVGGVVVVRYGQNPLQVIEAVKDKVAQIRDGLPKKTLTDGSTSQVTVVPFYDRSGLIHETLDTLGHALRDEILVTVLVMLVMLAHLRSAILVSALLPLAVLACFIAMRTFGVDANIVALSGIAIAIGTMVDVGVVMVESILREVAPGDSPQQRFQAVFRGASNVGSAVLCAVLTTVISFLPVFAMEGAEGKLFKPLAFTKTFALVASIAVALLVLPAFAWLLLRRRRERTTEPRRRPPRGLWHAANLLLALAVALLLAHTWAPLGPGRALRNVAFTVVLLGAFLLAFWLLHRAYEPLLRACLRHKLLFLSLPLLLVAAGASVWLGFGSVFGFVPRALAAASFGAIDADAVRRSGPWSRLAHALPGLGKEFMPRLDEGSFLLMPVTMPHASIGEATELLQLQDMAIRAIPEVDTVVGKIGRVDGPLDPAPIGMVETVITYVAEYRRGDDGELVRQWRDHIRSPDDIWHEIERAAAIPGMTVASMLQPIETRRIMLQTGMRAAFGVKVYGPDLATVQQVGEQIEALLRQVPSVRAETVIADRIVGKPYSEIDIDRKAIARYGLRIADVQEVIEVAVGGHPLTTTVEGRERYPVRVRYQRELRDSPQSLSHILVAAGDGTQIPLGQLAQVRYAPGPQVIRSEDTFLVGYVIFDKQPDRAEVDVVEDCQRFLAAKTAAGELQLPAGVSYRFAGNYENQVRASQRLMVVLPLALFLIVLVLWFQFRSMVSTTIVFSGVFVAWAGGFLLLWLYGQDWFLAFDLFGTDLRQLFGVRPYSLSVAVWVGFLALFGIATDDGVLMSTYLQQSFSSTRPTSRAAIRDAVVAAGLRRIRPCLMTTATTVLALLPVLSSRGRGSDVMVPMAIPSFGGMLVVLVSVFVVPTLWCWREERALRRQAPA